MKEEQFLDNSEGLSIAGKNISLVISLIEFTLYHHLRLDRKTTKDARDVITFVHRLAMQDTTHAARN
jgi:hypothetical protein